MAVADAGVNTGSVGCDRISRASGIIPKGLLRSRVCCTDCRITALRRMRYHGGVMNVIAGLDRVSYTYPRSESFALRDISLDIREGEFLGVIGPTGAGKSTLCMALNGIVPQFYGGRFFGHVMVAGLDTLEHPISSLARHVGIVLEDPETQITAISVENEVAFAMENLRIPRDEIRARIPQVLEAVRLEGLEKKHPHELSGGQKQRLAIAAALALQPQLLVLDEPTSQLDPVGAQEIFAVVRELNQVLGITIVMASHAAEEMAVYTDRVALLFRGALVRLGTPDEIYSDVPLLDAHDLRPPQVARTFYLMQQAGLPVTEIPVRLSDGVERLQQFRATGRGDTLSAPVVPSLPVPRSGSPLISVRDLVHVYEDGTRALRGVSLDIHAGEYVMIVGQNGAGKSTLVKHFVNLLVPTEGTVRVGGRETRELAVSELAQRIGYVGQNPDTQIFSMTVEEEVAFALRHLQHQKGVPAVNVTARVTESLDAMGLHDVRHRHPLALPRGDRARVVVAAILAMQPEIVIFDEPTTGQDDRGARAILEISRSLHAQGKTVIIITHHLYLMPPYAERVIVMGEGTILLDAPIRRAFHAIDTLAATYLVPPQAVFLARAACSAAAPSALLLTPEEVAACVVGRPLGEDA